MKNRYLITIASLFIFTIFTSPAMAQSEEVSKTTTTKKQVKRYYRKNVRRQNVRPNKERGRRIRHYRTETYIRPSRLTPIPVITVQPVQVPVVSTPTSVAVPVYEPQQPVIVLPEGKDRPGVYRYIRHSGKSVVIQDGNTGYIYMTPEVDQPRQVVQNPQVIQAPKPPEPTIPDISCPIYTQMQKSDKEVWCETNRGLKHGPYRKYFRNGELKSDGSYLYGYEDGRWVNYYKNGAIKSEGIFRNGEKSGTWRIYSKRGKVEKIDYN